MFTCYGCPITQKYCERSDAPRTECNLRRSQRVMRDKIRSQAAENKVLIEYIAKQFRMIRKLECEADISSGCRP